MKLNHLLKTLAITAALIGGGLVVNQTTAQAKGFTWLKTKDYSANPPLYTAKTAGQSVTMWNAKHTKKLHNLKNYPTTQWSVTQSVKMYNPKKTWGNKTGIYYKLTTQTGKYYGYVHRNFVKRVNTNGEIPTNSQSVIEQQNKTILSLFPGAINYGPDVLINRNEFNIQKSVNIFPSSDDLLRFKQVITHTLSYKNYVLMILKKQNINPSDYIGWGINVVSYDPDGKDDEIDPYNNAAPAHAAGTFDIILAPLK